MWLNVRERILTIRLMEKISANPAYAKALGLVVKNGQGESCQKTASSSAD
jgi:hypothetical protein